MTIKELQTQLLALTSDEKSHLIQFLSSSLETPWQGINKTDGVMGGDACIRATRIPVWLLVSYHRMGLTEAKILENYPTLTAIDLVNAWSYTNANSDEIDREIDRQEEDSVFSPLTNSIDLDNLDRICTNS
jgi:uncharacterized protein (DUF433 family)